MTQHNGSQTVNLNFVYKNYLKCLNNYSDYISRVDKALRIFGAFEKDDNISQKIFDIHTMIELDILSALEVRLFCFHFSSIV